MKKFNLKEYMSDNPLLKEDKEHSTNVEAHELLEMIKDNLDYLSHGDELIIKVNHSDDMHGYDIEFEILELGNDSLDHMFKGTTTDDIDF